MTAYIQQLFPGTIVTKVRDAVPNPVLSKLKVNILERYENL